ncbi:MAG: rhodanese-like domain-containing protein [Flavobacteriaceae bacterium]
MKTIKITLITAIVLLTNSVVAQDALDSFLLNFSYENRKEMKVSSEQIVQLLQEDKALLVDIRFEEEQASWQMDYALKMPLATIPLRYKELPKNKLIVTACPHKDRAIIAMVYLKSKGYQVAYLKDGLLGLADYLKGDEARKFIENLKN